eukprot:SAG11_NODE_1627_length_4552_cov_4.548619_2_plen_33_part_00
MFYARESRARVIAAEPSFARAECATECAADSR